MKPIVFALLLAGVCLAPGSGWSAGDYALSYSAIDLTGGPATGTGTPVEDIVTLEFQGPTCESTSYTIASLLRYCDSQNAVSNWTLYY